jgi:hypothetical protein
LKVLAVVILFLMLIAIGIALKLHQEVRIARSPRGDVIRLEGYAFRPGKVRYDLPNRPIARLLAKVLPEAAKKRVRWLRPEVTVFVTASFPNEPVLSAAFSSRDLENRSALGTRIVVLDDRGQTFDSVLNYLGNNGVFEAVAFPRRGHELRLRLMNGEEAMAEFRIKNPCPGPHAVWKPQPMPVAVTNAALKISLEKFVADAASQRTRCGFRIRNHGQESAAYLPAVFEISDATGNHWRPAVDPPVQQTNGWVTGSFFGALWPDEEAWKLRVEFKPADKGFKDQTARVVEFVAKPEQVRGDSARPELKKEPAGER